MAALWAVATGAGAFTLGDGTQIRCVVDLAGARYEVPEEFVGNGRVGERHPELGGSAAVVRRAEDGRPKIVFDTYMLDSIRAKLPLARDFVFLHECAHIQLATLDEIDANCHALREARRRGLIDADGEAALGDFHRRMGRLPLKYGTSGVKFWERTQACVDAPARDDEIHAGFPGEADTPFAP
ncbi:MAG: hypothetical protein MUF30_13795 [Burkholderiales bacterium]|nr:hypothetical protein [Burkholderiales bacterium]